MTGRTHNEIVEHIIRVINEYVTPAVEQHGGAVNFINFEKGTVLVELSGACSGCAGSYHTLKSGIENILRNMIVEVERVEGIDDPFSDVDPYFSVDPFTEYDWEYLDLKDIDDELDN